MMRLICVYTLLVFANVLWAQPNKYADKIKLLEQKGLPYFYNDEIRANIDAWIKNKNGATSTIAGRFDAMNFVLEYASRTNGLPWFVKFIPAANTGLNNLYSSEGGLGMWPLNFTMGKKYSLVQNSFIDERFAPEQSSDAACKYLAELFHIYKDWLKVITAFKITPLRLNQVIRMANNSLDFKDIYEKLSPGEREPILQFYAAMVVLNNREEFGITTPISLPEIKSDTVSTEESLSFSMIEEYTGIKARILTTLNPEFKTASVHYFGTTAYFRVPKNQKNDYNRMRDTMIKVIRIKRNPPVIMDTVIRIIDSVTYVEIIPRVEKPQTPVIIKPAKMPVTNAKAWVWYTVKAGDGLYTLSDAFDCTMQELRSWNYIRGNLITVGQRLKFYVPSAKLSYYKKINGMGAAQKRALGARD